MQMKESQEELENESFLGPRRKDKARERNRIKERERDIMREDKK